MRIWVNIKAVTPPLSVGEKHPINWSSFQTVLLQRLNQMILVVPSNLGLYVSTILLSPLLGKHWETSAITWSWRPSCWERRTKLEGNAQLRKSGGTATLGGITSVALLLSTLLRNRVNFLKGKLWTVSERNKWSDCALIQVSVQLALLSVGGLN